jgi:hypothetical protein
MANRKSSVSIGRNVSEEDERELANDADFQAVLREQNEEKENAELNKRLGNKGADPPKNGFALSELGQIAPPVPHRWVDVDRPDWLYRNPKQEFVESPFPLDIATLAHRWEGLWTQLEIELAYSRENWVHLRFQFQDARDALAFENSLAKDAAYQTRVLNQDIERMSIILEKLMADFTSGWEYRPVKGAGAFAYVKMPMTVEAKIKLANMIRQISQFRGVRVGLFSDLVGSASKVQHTVAEELRNAQAEQNEGYKKLLAISGLSTTDSLFQSQLPPGAQIVEGYATITNP